MKFFCANLIAEVFKNTVVWCLTPKGSLALGVWVMSKRATPSSVTFSNLIKSLFCCAKWEISLYNNSCRGQTQKE